MWCLWANRVLIRQCIRFQCSIESTSTQLEPDITD